MDLRAGAPFEAQNTFTAASPLSWVLSFLLSSPGCLQSSCFCYAETQLSHKPWGNLPIQIRQVQSLPLKVLSWGSTSVNPGSIKLAVGYGCSLHRIMYEVRNSSISAGCGFATLTSYFFSRRRYSCFISRGKPSKAVNTRACQILAFKVLSHTVFTQVTSSWSLYKEPCLLRHTPKSPKTWFWKEVCSSKCKYCCPQNWKPSGIYRRKWQCERKTVRFGGKGYRAVPGIDKTQEFSDIVITTAFGQGLALQLQLLSSIPQCFPLLSLRQHFPSLGSSCLEQFLGTFAGQTTLASCCGTTAGKKIFVVLGKMIPSHFLSVTGVIFLRSLWRCEVDFRCFKI